MNSEVSRIQRELSELEKTEAVRDAEMANQLYAVVYEPANTFPIDDFKKWYAPLFYGYYKPETPNYIKGIDHWRQVAGSNTDRVGLTDRNGAIVAIVPPLAPPDVVPFSLERTGDIEAHQEESTQVAMQGGQSEKRARFEALTASRIFELEKYDPKAAGLALKKEWVEFKRVFTELTGYVEYAPPEPVTPVPVEQEPSLPPKKKRDLESGEGFCL